jgi:hypothetical protein
MIWRATKWENFSCVPTVALPAGEGASLAQRKASSRALLLETIFASFS